MPVLRFGMRLFHQVVAHSGRNFRYRKGPSRHSGLFVRQLRCDSPKIFDAGAMTSGASQDNTTRGMVEIGIDWCLVGGG